MKETLEDARSAARNAILGAGYGVPTPGPPGPTGPVGPACDVDNGEFKIKDSGERRECTTGSVRDKQVGKGRYDLISPIALLRLAKHYEAGAIKYAARNWEKGQPLSWYLDSAIRHLQKFLAGERDEDHITACAWNCFALVHTEEMIQRGRLPADLNDLPNFNPFAMPAAHTGQMFSSLPTPNLTMK